MTAAEDLFRSKVVPWMDTLMKDFGFDHIEAGAVFGNIGHECNGFLSLQEKKPIVAGSRGGYGWPQWTGPRRVAYEDYCKRTGKNPASDEANYAFLFLELSGQVGTEGRAVARVKAAPGLRDKVVAFELSFLRAHKDYKHYDSRLKWAKIAIEEWEKVHSKDIKAAPTEPVVTKPSDMITTVEDEAVLDAKDEPIPLPTWVVVAGLVALVLTILGLLMATGGRLNG